MLFLLQIKKVPTKRVSQRYFCHQNWLLFCCHNLCLFKNLYYLVFFCNFYFLLKLKYFVFFVGQFFFIIFFEFRTAMTLCFTESAIRANLVYSAFCPSICLSVCQSVCAIVKLILPKVKQFWAKVQADLEKNSMNSTKFKF